MDAEADQGEPYWSLSPGRQHKLLRSQLVDILDLVSEGQVGREDFAQELALDLNRLPETVLFTRGRPKNTLHRWKFNAAQKKTFLRLLGAYRWKKRGERVVAYADERWVDDANAPDGRRLVRRDEEFIFRGSIPGSANQEEVRAAARLDLLRAWEVLERSFREPVVLAALGLITAREAARALGLRKAAVLCLIRQAKALLSTQELAQ
jgi:DNA-directed RNA polymerase specialized sigma24 family protein